jgi:hypothetical protein
LIRRASRLFDEPGSELAALAPKAGNRLFRSGALWMKRAVEKVRGSAMPVADGPFNRLGFVKYGLASSAALAFVVTAWVTWQWLWLLGCVPAFYAVEAQMVFLFPLVLDGTTRPFGEARSWTVRAGGTLRVMATVLPLAATMLFGGLSGRGFVRSWCLGCLAVAIWYEDLRSMGVPS